MEKAGRHKSLIESIFLQQPLELGLNGWDDVLLEKFNIVCSIKRNFMIEEKHK